MNRHRQGRDRAGMRGIGLGGPMGDGLLGEGPGMGAVGGFQDRMVNQQLLLAQTLLQQQKALTQQVGMGLGGGAMSMGDMQFMQGGRPAFVGGGGRMGPGRIGGHYNMSNDRKRSGQSRDRNSDSKRRRQDSSGRGGERDSNRSRGKDDKRGGEGRDRNRSSRGDTDDKANGKDDKANGKDDYDPAEPTEAEDVEGGNGVKKEKVENDSENDDKGKDSNLYCHVCKVSVYDDESFKRHLNGMKHANRMNSLLHVHEIKSIQIKSRLKAEEHLRHIERKEGPRDPDYFCKICNNDLTIPWKRHSFSNIHKQRLLQVRRGCGWCGVHDFTNFSEVLDHRDTDQHKKNAEIYGKKDDKENKEKDESKSKTVKVQVKKEEEEEDLTIPDYDPEKPAGLNYIIPVTGFFCKLCHKFYNNEKSAKVAHCQSQGHYEKFKLAMEAKIEAREKRRAEEAEAEEKRRQEEEEQREKEEREAKEREEAEAASGETNREETRMEEDGDDHAENAETKQTKQEDEEDYDDELPLVDEDGDGGTIERTMDEDGDYWVQPDQSGTEGASFLDDTNADASFEFLSGAQAQAAQLELQKEAEIVREPEEEEEEELAADGTEGLKEPLLGSPREEADLLTETPADAMETSLNASQGTEEASSQEEAAPIEETPPTPVVAKATARRGTARRGRRGRAKK